MSHPDVKEAIEVARTFLSEVMDDIKEIRFEGVEMDPEVNNSWSLTFSIFRSPMAGPNHKNFGALELSRLDKSFYKVIVDNKLKIHSVSPTTL